MRGRLRRREIATWLARTLAEIGLISVLLFPLAVIVLALVVDAALAERVMRVSSSRAETCRLTANEANCLVYEQGEPHAVTFRRSTR